MKALVGIYSPKPGCGKTTLTQQLLSIAKLAVPVKFAGPLKDAAYSILIDLLGDVDRVHRIINGDLKNEAIDEIDGMTGREFMQKLGTDFGRNMIHRDLWLRCTDQAFGRCSSNAVVIVDDLRFENEYDFLRERGGYLIRLDRPDISDAFCDHPSEGALERRAFDADLFNGGTILDLQKTAPVVLARAVDHYETWKLEARFRAKLNQNTEDRNG